MQIFNSATSFRTFTNMRSSAYAPNPRPSRSGIHDPNILDSIFSEPVNSNGSSSGGNSDASETKRGK